MAGIESELELGSSAAYPRLSDAQLARLRSYGVAQAVTAGDVLYRPGDATYDLIVTEDTPKHSGSHTGDSTRAPPST